MWFILLSDRIEYFAVTREITFGNTATTQHRSGRRQRNFDTHEKRGRGALEDFRFNA